MKRKKTDKPDGRCATCPRWDRWHIRIPNPEDRKKLIELHRKSGAETKSDYVRGRLLNQYFKVITEDKSSEPYLRELSNILTKLRIIGVSYNEAVKTLNSYLSVKNSPANDTPARNLLRSYHQVTSTSDTADGKVSEEGIRMIISLF